MFKPGYVRFFQAEVNSVKSMVTCLILLIGLSIVQGSGIGPTLYPLYTIMKCGLHALSETNDIFKYADETGMDS